MKRLLIGLTLLTSIPSFAICDFEDAAGVAKKILLEKGRNDTVRASISLADNSKTYLITYNLTNNDGLDILGRVEIDQESCEKINEGPVLGTSVDYIWTSEI